MRHLLPITIAALLATGCVNTWEPPGGTGGGNGGLAPTLIGIGLSPVNPKVTLGEEIQFTATGFYSNQTTVEITDTVEWATSDSGVLQIAGGLDVEGLGSTLAAGSSQVKANFFEIESNVVTVTVTDALIESLTVSPGAAQLEVDGTLQLAAEAEFSDGSRGNVSGSVRWITDDGTIVTIDTTGKITAKGPGSTTIHASYEQGATTLEATPVTVQVVGEGVSVGEADVRVVGLDAVSSEAGATYTVEVRNSGSAPASGFWVDVWLNRTATPDPPPTSGDAYEYIELLEPSETTEVLIEVETSPGTFNSWAMVDSFANVAEGSLGEGNNVWGPQAVTITSDAGPIGPDLAISYLQGFVQVDQVLYVVDVTNTGDQVSSAFDVGVYSNPGFPPATGQTPDEVAEVTALSPGETETLTIIVRALPESPWQSYVLADIDGSVTEPNEGNNVSGFLVIP
ncbi:MAG: Ig-like domain-containing protein [Deltaproteobacteria bacterium]|nr:Ig-like domain-containing protein [Deltaproteobacteria bacterium]